ncbi:hypothetical protein GCM10010275_17080 [Streptomyces litmocidini]|nr:hypothetical protein GCM10010275_17080 [Streptomyces litmocidini]
MAIRIRIPASGRGGADGGAVAYAVTPAAAISAAPTVASPSLREVDDIDDMGAFPSVGESAGRRPVRWRRPASRLRWGRESGEDGAGPPPQRTDVTGITAAAPSNVIRAAVTYGPS